ncbi:hypothetical protein HUJ05_000808 [Dendroctonus ponderosae]|nr:hypothetical protein HUJ05_000808 [Dendroctonus ponderosae]
MATNRRGLCSETDRHMLRMMMMMMMMIKHDLRMCLNVIGESSQHPHFDDVKTRLGSVGMTSNLTLSLPEKTQCQLGR